MTFALLLAAPSLAQSLVIAPNPQEACLEPGDDSPEPDLTDWPPSGDSRYDLYVQQVSQIGDLFDDTHVPQLGEGMAGLLGPQPGTVFTIKVDPGHMIEHWFVDLLPAQYDGGLPFGLDYAGPAAGVDLGLVPGWEGDTWLYMDIQYQKVADDTPLSQLTLGYANGPDPDTAILEGYGFDLTQDNEVRGHLLRERHSLDTWVDYWLFTADYVPVGDPVAGGGDPITVDPWMVPPADAADFFATVGGATSFEHFAQVTYKVRKGCAYGEFVEIGALDEDGRVTTR